MNRFMPWLGIGASKFYDWKARFGKVNEHNAWVPRDHWLTPEERERIKAFARQHPLDGYRQLTFMMLDQNVVAASPASVYRVLKNAGLLAGQAPKPTKKGTGFAQPIVPHQHWHVDVSHLNIAGTFYFLCSVLDGCSRYLVHWEIRPKMEENDVQTILQRARERFPGEHPRIITDNGPQFIAKGFKEFIRSAGMTHVKTSPYYPQANGKMERWYKTLKGDCIRPKVPLSIEDARRIVTEFVASYNDTRLHSAIGYITPNDRLHARHTAILEERDRKLVEARERRKLLRQAARADDQAANQHRPLGEDAAPDADRPPIDFNAVRAAVRMADVLALLGFRARTTHGAQQRGPCPLHGSTSATSRCFSVNLADQIFHCFKCGRSGNALDLWTHATQQTPYDAALDLCQRLNIPVPTLPPKQRHREEEPVAPLPGTCTMELP
ncbi:MAG TPA: IS3 family transposase [Terriglobia bacterium]|nr:IS3 family transposase [Terriglobia bacterium]